MFDSNTSLIILVLIFGGLGAFGRISLSSYKPNLSSYTLGSVVVGGVSASIIWGLVTIFEGKPIPFLGDFSLPLTSPVAIAVGGVAGLFTDVILARIHHWLGNRAGYEAWKKEGIDRRKSNGEK